MLGKTNTQRRRRVLAVCSGGGHWVQMKRLQPAFVGSCVTYASVHRVTGEEVGGAQFFRLPDANKDTKLRMLALLIRMLWILIRVRPHVVISTGAAPGYLAVRIGRLLGARTLFLDSIANAEQLSLSASMCVGVADVTLSQWRDVAEQNGLQHWGAVL
ncbi:MAG: hypothetical protein ACE361_21680 [Aureliella sp.]